LEILTVKEILEGKKLEYAQLADATIPKAQRKSKKDSETLRLFQS